MYFSSSTNYREFLTTGTNRWALSSAHSEAQPQLQGFTDFSLLLNSFIYKSEVTTHSQVFHIT